MTRPTDRTPLPPLMDAEGEVRELTAEDFIGAIRGRSPALPNIET